MQSQWPECIYVLIPSYKSIDSLKTFIPQLLKVVPKNKICIVDDASMDGTGQFCNEMHLTYISHPVNQGKGAALVSGFAFLLKKNARWIITMDADGQHSPEDIPKLLSYVKKYPETGICIGNRKKTVSSMPLARILSNVLTSGILSIICRCKILDSQCGYRIYSAELLKNININYKRFEMETEVIMKSVKSGFPVYFVDVRTLYLNGPSHISHLKDTIRWVKAVINIWLAMDKFSKKH